MRLLSWLLCAAAAVLPVLASEEKSISRPKRDSPEKKIVCYYTNWSVYRPGSAKYTPQNINPYLCTHLIYAFGGLSKDNALKPFDKYQDIEQGGYAKFNGLKTYNKKLKTLLAIGGWNEGSVRFSPLVADAERRKELVKNTVKFLRQNHFDGLDLDWEYPSFRDGGKPRDRDNYATLVQEFREEFERESEKTGRPRLLLTMAVPAGIEYIDKGYDVPKLNKYLDWMNILSYDYHSAFEPAINHHSPLFSLEEDDEYNFDAQLNIDHTVQHYLKLGADRSKLVLGIPTYGRSYTLFNSDATDIGSPADGPGEQGEATREKGYLAYYEICERVKSGGWTLENPNPEAMGPYAFKDNQWVGFDDVEIVKAKAKYVNDNDLGGIMFWSIDNDDFRGKCHNKAYPLIEAAKEALLASANDLSSARKETKQEQESVTKTKPRKSRLRTKASTSTESSKTKENGRTTTTPQPPTTPDPGSDFVCKDEGFFPHPRDCKKYFWCLDSGPSSLGIVAHQFTCPSGLVFNKISDSCDYARNVICKTKSEPSTTTSTTTTTTTTTSRTTTVRSRLIITASPPRPTTTTTTQAPDDEEEDEEDEEDPGTIKELIQLIKKLGGVEQLEKQLNLQSADGKEKIKPSLYSRVFQGRAQNKYRGVNDETTTTERYVSVFRNRPVRPQSPSTEEVTTSARSSEKPRYVTIQRNRPTKKPLVEEDVEEEEEEQEEEVKPKVETPRSFRRRPNTETTSEREYVILRRSQPQKEEATTQKYKNIVRVRSTTKAPIKEEEDEEEEEKKEEKALEEEEEIIEEDREEEEEEEEKEEENERGQKLKKYSSIVRDNKKQIPEEKESKVSGPQGPRNKNEDSDTATDSILIGKDNVNTVNIKSGPIYTEIRRKQSTTRPSNIDVDVYNVNILHDDQKNKEEANEVSENETENKSKTFQRRITTEIIRRTTKPTFPTTTLGRETAVTEQNKYENTRASTVAERFITSPVTDSTLTTKPLNRYKTLKKNNPEHSIYNQENELNQSPQKEKKLKSSTTSTTANEENKLTTDPPRKFQFAQRKKPNILLQKPSDSTTEPFQITVPDFPSDTLSDNTLGSHLLSTTTKPSTVAETILEGPVHFNRLQNDEFLTTLKEFSSSTRRSVPSTSTQTTVVTSITESSITERRRILVPKKSLYKSELESKFDTIKPTRGNILETTTPLSKFSGYRTVQRSTTPKAVPTTDFKVRRFKFKSTTTETPVPERKFEPKQKKNFKRTTTEEPERTSVTTERFRFRSRNKPQQTENSPTEGNNLSKARLVSARRKKFFSKKEDDLEVDQTATFFDDFDSEDRVILGGTVRQTSERDYLNADVHFRNTPVKEKVSGAKEEDDVNLLELNKIAVTPASSNTRTSARTNLTGNRFVTINPALRNLRTKSRNTDERNSTNERSPESATRSNFQTYRSRNINKDLRGRLTERPREITQTEDEGSGDIKRIKTPSQRPVRIPSRNNFPAQPETVSDRKGEKAFDERLDTKPQIRNISSLRSNQSNVVNLRTRTKQVPRVNENIFKDLVNETSFENLEIKQPLLTVNDEKPTRTPFSKNGGERSGQETTAPPVTSVSYSVTQSTRLPTNVSQRLRQLKIRTDDSTKTPEPATANTKEPGNENEKYEQVDGEVEGSVSETTSPSVSTTFGTKSGPTVSGSTASLTFGTKIASLSSSTAGLTTGSRINNFPRESTTRSSFTTRALDDDKGSADLKAKELTESPKSSVSSNFLKLRSRNRENSVASSQGRKEESAGNKTDSSRSIRTRGKVKAIDSIFQATEGNGVTDTEKRSGRTFFPKDRRKVLVRTRPVQASPQPDEEENELELPEEIASNFRTRGRSSQFPSGNEQANKRRTQLDRRRFRGESRTSTVKPEVQTETSVSVSKSSILLRRRLRPTTSTTTTTTTQKPYTEQLEDSSLEESKSLDETPGIQDLADPAVVAIHYLATVSPGPGVSSVTSSVNPNPYSQTSDTYTVHVTPSDIASFSTPRIPSVTAGSPVSLRPTSILTLKPYTTPLITKQYAPKQSPSPFRAPPFRAAAVSLVTEEPYTPQGEILLQSRKQDTTQRAKPTTSIISAVPQKAAEPKSRRLKPFSKVPKQEVGQAVTSSEPPVDYEYYDDDNDPLANIPASALKVKVHSDGYIECLDRGNFPHPFSCKKFISCAKMENNELLGWEYTCPKHLSFDPVGGICNWSAGLGCQH